MATFDYNPITGNLDLVGSGASYIDGVVADPTALPVTVGTPPLDSVYLAKAGSGVWLINRRPAGLYCRVANNGNAADWTYLGAFPEVNSSANWELYDGTDPTKELKFDLSGITTGTTRTLTAPNASGRIQVEGQPIGSTTPSTGAFTTLSANNGTITASAPVLDLSQTWNNAAVTFTGLRFNATDTASAAASNLAEFQLSGTALAAIRKDGSFRVLGTGDRTLLAHPNFALSAVAGGAWLGVNTTISLSSAGNFVTAGGLIRLNDATSANPVELNRDAADTLAQRRTTNPQTFRIYNTTDAGLTNFERGFLRWSSNVLQIGAEKGGTGSARNLELLTDNTWRARLQGEGLLLNTSGPRVYFGNPLISGDAESNVSLDLQPFGAGNVIIRSGLLKMNGTTSSFPALKRSSTTLQVRLADDSAFAPFEARDLSLTTAGAAAAETVTTFTHGRGSNGDSIRMNFLPRGAANTSANAEIRADGLGGPLARLTFRVNGSTRIQLGEGTPNVSTPSSTFADSFALASGSTMSADVILAREAANTLSLVNATNAQTFRIYNTFTSSTSFERLNIRWASNECIIDAEAGSGGGTLRGIKIGSATSSLLGFYGATPVDRPATVADPAGGGTIDAEARTAINDLIDRLQELGLIA